MFEAHYAKLTLALAAIVWFALLGHRDLIEPDEARYSEIPREMVASGDWITPRLNDFKYFEKPALQYWLTAISFELFGQSNATARLWLASAGFLCALFMGFLGARLYNSDTGLLAFIITLSGLLYTVMSHLLTLDMTLTLFMTLGLGSLVLAQSQRDNAPAVRNWMLLGWAALAAAVLSKGLVGVVLPGAAVFVYMIWQRDWALLRHLHAGKGLLLLLALTAPWLILVSQANPEFARFFFIHEHFERYTTEVHHRAGPMYYFIPLFLLGVCPWLVSSLSAIFKPDFSWKADSSEGFNPERLVWVYIIFILLFFSMGKSKLPPYILPVFPFVGLLAARRLQTGNTIKWDEWTMAFLALLFFATGILVTRFASTEIPKEVYVTYRPWIVTAALILGAGALVMHKWKADPKKAVIAAGLCSILGYQTCLWGYQALATSRSSAGEAAAILNALPETATVYTVGCYPQSLPFYLNRTVTIVDKRGELKMGIEAEPDKWVPTLEAFVERWQQEEQAAAVMEPDAFEELVKLDVPMRKIYGDSRHLVFVKP